MKGVNTLKSGENFVVEGVTQFWLWRYPACAVAFRPGGLPDAAEGLRCRRRVKRNPDLVLVALDGAVHHHPFGGEMARIDLDPGSRGDGAFHQKADPGLADVVDLGRELFLAAGHDGDLPFRADSFFGTPFVFHQPPDRRRERKTV